MDTSEYACFRRPGHRVTGDRSSQDRQRRDGVDVVHAIIDDHSRLAYAEIHPDAKQATVAASSTEHSPSTPSTGSGRGPARREAAALV